MNPILPKFLQFVKDHQSDLVLGLVIVMITVISFNLGRLSVQQKLKTPVTIQDSSQEIAGSSDNKNLDNLPVVASQKSTSHYYHFSWCSGAKQIAEANKLTFANEAAALVAGYKLASNCTK